jgi:DNA-binding MarR family transcriptional regulator
MDNSPAACANALLEIVPLIMRNIRAKVRRQSGPELSVAQFRALAFLGRNERAMLSDVANFLALTLPAASKMIDGLVGTGLATREIDPADRRKVNLALTSAGTRKYADALKFTADYLAKLVAHLNESERTAIARAMKALDKVFTEDPPETRNGSLRSRNNHALRLKP